MNEAAHTNIFRGAVEALPEEYKGKLIQHQELFDYVGNYPDYFDDPTRPEEVKAKIDPQWRTYCEYPPEMAAQCMHFWPHKITDAAGRRPLIEYLLNQMLKTYEINDMVAFLKFSGCLSHLFGDTTQAAHLDHDTSCTFMSQLLPTPDDEAFADFNYHTTVEAVTGQCDRLDVPALQGTSIEATAWRIGSRCQESIVFCRRFIVPIIQALFAKNRAKAEEYAAPAVTIAAQLTADTMFTIIKIAEDSFSDSDIAKLECSDLRTLKADREFQEMVYGGVVLDGNKDVPPNNAPITPAALLDKNGNEYFIKGLGMLPHSGVSGERDAWLQYDLPKGVFKIFSATIGLHVNLAVGGAVEFMVEQDDKVVYKSGRMTSKDSARHIEVDISEASQLTIKVKDANGGTSFWKNHAYWGEPVLKK